MSRPGGQRGVQFVRARPPESSASTTRNEEILNPRPPMRLPGHGLYAIRTVVIKIAAWIPRPSGREETLRHLPGNVGGVR